MLRCTMDSATLTQLRLDDLLADLVQARRNGDLGRLALLAYCEVRRWARTAGEGDLAVHAARLVIDSPQPNREAFLAAIDKLIADLERLQIERATAPGAQQRDQLPHPQRTRRLRHSQAGEGGSRALIRSAAS
jgi:hypothetical protein